MLKKSAALCLVMMLLLGCVAHAATADYVGEWILTGAEMNGEFLEAAFQDSLVLYADGSCTMTRMGQMATWEVCDEGVVLTDEIGDSLTYVLVEGNLVSELDDMKFIYTRKAEPAVSGIWKLGRMTMLGMDFSAESLGVEMAIWLDEGDCGLLTAGGSEDVAQERVISYQVGRNEEAVLEIVLYTAEADQREQAVLYTLHMSENGELYAEENGKILWFVKQQSEEAQ